jgi:hypothetical protein
VDEREQPSNQFLTSRIVAGLGSAGESVCFVPRDRVRRLGLIPQLFCGGVAATPLGASRQLALHDHTPIVPHGRAAP